MSEKYLIFGATGSIGSSLAEQLKNSGNDIHLVARNESEVGSIAENLGCGFTVADVLDEGFIEKLKLKMPEITYIYSQNSAINFLKVIKNYQLETLWMNTNLMCVGEKTSSILNEIKWKKIFLFNPGEEEFLLYKI